MAFCLFSSRTSDRPLVNRLIRTRFHSTALYSRFKSVPMPISAAVFKLRESIKGAIDGHTLWTLSKILSTAKSPIPLVSFSKNAASSRCPFACLRSLLRSPSDLEQRCQIPHERALQIQQSYFGDIPYFPTTSAASSPRFVAHCSRYRLYPPSFKESTRSCHELLASVSMS
jgi:hypothetical protein